MKISKKSKLLALTLGATMLVSAFSMTAFAASVSIVDVDAEINGDYVDVTVTYTADAEVSQSTILATVGETSGEVTYSDSEQTTPNNIAYIDQQANASGENVFTFKFDKSMVQGKKLFVKVGGTNATPASVDDVEIEGGGQQPTYKYGDVNNDGDIDSVDASLILQYYAGTLEDFPVNKK